MVPHWLLVVGAWSWRLLAGVAVLVVAGTALRRLEVVVVPTLVAVLIATVLAPPAGWLRRRGCPARLATLAVFAAAGAVLAGIGVWLVPVFAREASLVGPQLGDGFDRLQAWAATGPLGLSDTQVASYRAELGAALTDAVRGVPADVAWGARTALDLTVGVVVSVVLAVFAVNDGSRFTAAVLARADPTGARRLRALTDDLWFTLGGYVRAAAANGLVNGAALAFGLTALRVPLVVPLAVVAFISAFAPLVGAFVSGGIAALVALADAGPARAGVVVLLVIGIHLLEGYITGPLVMGRALRLPPAAVLLALSIGGVLGGVWGLLFAAPATACGLAVWRWTAAGSTDGAGSAAGVG